jgi:hypothetical protein
MNTSSFAGLALLAVVFVISTDVTSGMKCYSGSPGSFLEKENCTICMKAAVSGSFAGIKYDSTASSCVAACTESKVEVYSGVSSIVACCSTDLCNTATTTKGASLGGVFVVAMVMLRAASC